VVYIYSSGFNLDAGRGWNSLLYELSSLLVLLPLAKKLLNLRLFSISQCRALEHFFEAELNKLPKDGRWVVLDTFALAFTDCSFQFQFWQ
jgi:hypothetical protein